MLKGLRAHSLVPFGDSVLVFGEKKHWSLGVSGDEGVYNLTCSNKNCNWTRIPQRPFRGQSVVKLMEKIHNPAHELEISTGDPHENMIL